MNTFAKLSKHASSIGLGFLIALSFTSAYHFIQESELGFIKYIFLIISFSVASIVGYLLSKHLSVCTHDHKDSFVDKTFITLVILGSLIHTALDGLVIHESFIEGNEQGLILLGTILFHELVRTTLLYKVLRVMEFKNLFSAFIVFGISTIGIFLGFMGSSALEGLHKHEAWIELFTGAIFFIVVIDLYLFTKHHNKKSNILWTLLGILIYLLITNFISIEH